MNDQSMREPVEPDGRALTFVTVGLEAHPINVEVTVARGTGHLHVVGLSEAEILGARDRVRIALRTAGFDLQGHDIVVSLGPTDLPKGDGTYDLAVAGAILVALGKISQARLAGIALIGQFSAGDVCPVRGVLPMLQGARRRGITRAVVPCGNAREASYVSGVEVRVCKTLTELLAYFTAGALLKAPDAPANFTPTFTVPHMDFADVHGQVGRRAAEIAAAGGHNMVLIGAPGSGKTALGRRMPTIMPPMTLDEALEATALHSVAGLLSPERGLLVMRPFRAPHFTVSVAGLVGGGVPVRPGEASLAHHGVLFLDELPEFKPAALEALRQPLESGDITVSRSKQHVRFPARPLIVASMNPCPCGNGGERLRSLGSCCCGAARINAYRNCLNGPLRDSIDIHVMLPLLSVAKLQSPEPRDNSATVRARVIAARAAQAERARRWPCATPNGALTGDTVAWACQLTDVAKQTLMAAMDGSALLRKAVNQVMRVARTIADLDGSGQVHSAHMEEALSLRVLDRPVTDPVAVPSDDQPTNEAS